MRGRATWMVLGLVLVAACASGGGYGQGSSGPSASPTSDGSTGTALPGLPADTLPGYVFNATRLDTATLSTDALDPASLESLLTGAGFETGTERRFTARDKRLTEVVARVLLFRSADGAVAYLAWLRTHGADLLGSHTREADPPSFPGAIAFSHGPSGCCTKDTFQYFAAWTRGPYALTLRVGGPDAGRRSAVPLAEELDARASKGVEG